MSNIAAFDASLAWMCLWQSSLLLLVGLLISRLLSRWAARAHCVLCLAIGVSVLAPMLTFAAARNGWGLLERSVTARLAPVISPDAQTFPTRDAPERVADAIRPARQFAPPIEPRMSPPTPALVAMAEPASATPEPTAPPAQHLPRVTATPVSWGTWLAAGWVGLSLLLLVRLAGSAWAGRRLLTAARIVDDPLIRRAALTASEQLGLR